MEKKKILEHVLERFEAMRREKADIDERAYRSYKMYHMIKDEEDKKRTEGEEWRSDFTDPYVFILCESILPNIYDAFFHSEKFVDVRGETDQAVEKEKKVQLLLEYYLKKSKFRQKAIDIIRSAIKYPGAVVKVKYRYDIGERIGISEKEIEGGIEKVKVIEEYVRYDGPDIELVPIWDFYIDPRAKSIEEAKDVIHRSIKDWGELKKEAEKLNRVLEEEVYDIEAIERLKESEFIYEGQNPLYRGEKGSGVYKSVELLEYWGSIDIDGDGEEEEVIVLIGNREEVISVREIPYWTVKKPFVIFRVIPKENEIWGRGVPELVESLWEELIMWRNMRADLAKLNIFPPMRVKAGSEYTEEDLKLYPGKVIEYLNEKDEIGFLPMRAEPVITQMEIQDLKQDMQQTAGPTDPIMGSNVGRGVNKTARGISIIAQASLSRMNIMVQSIAESFKEVIRYYLEFIKQYFNERKEIKIGEEREVIEPEDIIGDFEFEINFRDVKQVIEIEKQEIINLIAILGKIPGVDIKVIVEILLEYFPRLKGKIDKILERDKQGMEQLIQGNPEIKQAIKNAEVMDLLER